MTRDSRIEWVQTDDGVDVAAHVDGPADAPVALVVAHGFSMSSDDHRLRGLAEELGAAGRAVYTFDFRGHGRSSGVSTLGDLEVLDFEAVAALARAGSHTKLVAVGASMGGFVALRHAALVGGVDAVVAISTPATWGVAHRLRGRALMAAVGSPLGRRVLSARGTRVVDRLPVPPMSPSELAGRITVPVAVVHGGRDPYVPTDDAVLLHGRLGGPARLVILPEFGHAEAAYSPAFARFLDSLVDDLVAGEPRSPLPPGTGPAPR